MDFLSNLGGSLQDIDDPNFFGSFIIYKNKKFIVLNTHQNLRYRYYTAAHEMWHLALVSDMFGSESVTIKKRTEIESFDRERAAEHFAAALMLPKDAVKVTWNKYIQPSEHTDPELAKEVVIRIANVSSVPYVAVCRRVDELGLLKSKDLVGWKEENWLDYLSRSNFPPSPLDQPMTFEKFSGLTSFVDRMVKKKQMTLLEATNFLTDADPNQAVRYLEKRREIVDRISGEDDD